MRCQKLLSLVPGERLELSRCHHHRILSPARLPISPPRHVDRDYLTAIPNK